MTKTLTALISETIFVEMDAWNALVAVSDQVKALPIGPERDRLFDALVAARQAMTDLLGEAGAVQTALIDQRAAERARTSKPQSVRQARHARAMTGY